MASSLFRLTRLATIATRHQLTLSQLTTRPFSVGHLCCWAPPPAPPAVKSGTAQVLDRREQLDDKFTDAVLKAGDVESLMQLFDDKGMSITKAVAVIAAIGRLASRPDGASITESVMKDRHFGDVSRMLDRHIHGVNHSTLLTTLHHLLAIGLPADQHVIQSLETEVLWKLRKMSLRNLVHLLSFHVEHQSTELQRRVVAQTLDKIQQRWFEIGEAHEIISLLKLSAQFHADFLGHLEDRTMELAVKMSAEDLQRILSVLGERRLRPTHLLRALAFHLAKSPQRLSIKHMANVVHAASALNFHDAVLLRRISDDLLPEVANCTRSSQVASFLTGFGQLQWRHAGLMEVITEWIQKNASQCRPQDLVAYILAAARVHFVPSDADTFLPSLVARIPRDAIASKSVWLDLVWSLATLQYATIDQLVSVLQPSFYRELIGSQNSKKKLLCVYAVAKFETPNFKGFEAGETIVLECYSDSTNSVGSVCTSVLDTLGNSIPKGKFLTGPKILPSGIPVDGEFIVGSDGKPLAFEDSANQTTGGRTLPAGARRIALLVHDFKDYTHNDVKLVGHKTVSIRILQKLGYTVMQVPYMDYNVHYPTVKRLQYLQHKLNECLSKNNSIKSS